MKTAAIYARVSSDRQKRSRRSQPDQRAARIRRRARYLVPDDWVFEDEGWSGATLVRPGLERVRDLAAQGQIESLLVYSPDRLSRKYAYQVLLLEEFARDRVDVVFVRAPEPRRRKTSSSSVPGDDRRVREGPDQRADAAGKRHRARAAW